MKIDKGKIERGKIERKVYIEIDPVFMKTGEIIHIGAPIEVSEQEQKTPRGGFEIAYMSALFDIFDKLGGKKYTVLQYILKHKDAMNCLNMSNCELAKQCGVGRNTVVDTMKILTEAGVVVRKGTVIRLSARVFVKGDAQREAYIMRKFVEERDAAKEESDQIPGQMAFVGLPESDVKVAANE